MSERIIPCRLAQEIERKLKDANNFVAYGNYQNLICTNPNSEFLDTLDQSYLEVIEDLKALVAVIKADVQANRERHAREQYIEQNP
jgi:hypothetical protein